MQHAHFIAFQVQVARHARRTARRQWPADHCLARMAGTSSLPFSTTHAAPVFLPNYEDEEGGGARTPPPPTPTPILTTALAVSQFTEKATRLRQSLLHHPRPRSLPPPPRGPSPLLHHHHNNNNPQGPSASLAVRRSSQLRSTYRRPWGLLRAPRSWISTVCSGMGYEFTQHPAPSASALCTAQQQQQQQQQQAGTATAKGGAAARSACRALTAAAGWCRVPLCVVFRRGNSGFGGWGISQYHL
jgi:hypothetical protein